MSGDLQLIMHLNIITSYVNSSLFALHTQGFFLSGKVGFQCLKIYLQFNL